MIGHIGSYGHYSILLTHTPSQLPLGWAPHRLSALASSAAAVACALPGHRLIEHLLVMGAGPAAAELVAIAMGGGGICMRLLYISLVILHTDTQRGVKMTSPPMATSRWRRTPRRGCCGRCVNTGYNRAYTTPYNLSCCH